MSIPDSIKLSHIHLAISDIDQYGVPKGHESKKYDLSFNGRLYPPKYVIAKAHEFSDGLLLDSNDFSGGVNESNKFLQNFGFLIISKKSTGGYDTSSGIALQGKKAEVTSKPVVAQIIPIHKNERCAECKARVQQLLTKLYGKVIPQHSFDVLVHPEKISDPALISIYKILSEHRGFQDLTRASNLREVDFYMPDQRFIVEFDESQHFTIPRKLSLEHYPKEIILGFDKAKWIQKCSEMKKSDPNPPYRDEQRAWYDTIRDFLPKLIGLKPTVRLFANDFKWCKMDIDNPADLAKFKSFIEPDKLEIKVPKTNNPAFGRIVIARDWQGNMDEARNVILNVANSWPKDYKVEFLVTCGAFLQFNWPNLTRTDIGDNKNPNPAALKTLFHFARNCVHELLTPEVTNKLKEHIHYVTIGVDSYKTKISTTQNHISDLHTEMVCVYDLTNGKEYWTGKSYPTTKQEQGLIRITDISSHFLALEGAGSVLVLGCHDLGAFNNRNMINTGYWRKQIKNDFRKLAWEEEPNYVIHHPHTTVKVRTWQNSWSYFGKELPSVKNYIGAGRFNDPDSLSTTWDDMDNVLKKTIKGESIDFIVY